MTKKRGRLKNEIFTECARRKCHRPGNGVLKTEAEVAAALGESIRTIRSWRHRKIIPAVVTGYRSVRFVLEDVLKALKARTVREI